jgi:hypothetical protein
MRTRTSIDFNHDVPKEIFNFYTATFFHSVATAAAAFLAAASWIFFASVFCAVCDAASSKSSSSPSPPSPPSSLESLVGAALTRASLA